VDRYLRQHGFFALFVVGIALLVVGLTGQPVALIVGGVLALVGALARPIDEVVLKDGRVKWQQEVIEKVTEKLHQREDRGSFTEKAEVTVIEGDGAIVARRPSISGTGVVVSPEPARLRVTGHPPTVIVSPQSADEFANTLVEQVIEPTLSRDASD
jgi:hypothetical protein